MVNENSNDVNIKVVGIGGGGGNSIDNMIRETGNNSKVTFVAINTDKQALDNNLVEDENRILIGGDKGKGLGAGSKPNIGEEAAEESSNEIKKVLSGADMVFLTAGLGGGTGTGAIPVVARLAKEMGILTVSVITKPFEFEGRQRSKNAELGLEKLKEVTDTYIVIPNDKVIDISKEDTTLEEAFKLIDNVLKNGVLGICGLIIEHGLINLDFADVKTTLVDAGPAHMGVGEAKKSDDESGNACLKATEKAINSPLLESNINGAKRVILNFCSKKNPPIKDMKAASDMIYDLVDKEANIIWGATINENLEDDIVRVSVIATEFQVSSETSKIEDTEKIESLYENFDIPNFKKINFIKSTM